MLWAVGARTALSRGSACPPRVYLLPYRFLGFPKFFAIGKDNVHMLVKGEKATDEHSLIIESNAHSIIDELQHLATLCHRHFVAVVPPKRLVGMEFADLLDGVYLRNGQSKNVRPSNLRC